MTVGLLVYLSCLKSVCIKVSNLLGIIFIRRQVLVKLLEDDFRRDGEKKRCFFSNIFQQQTHI